MKRYNNRVIPALFMVSVIMLSACGSTTPPQTSAAGATQAAQVQATDATQPSLQTTASIQTTSSDGRTVSKPYEGSQLRVVFVTGQFTPNLEEQLDAFFEETGITVNLEVYAEAQLHQKCVTEFLSGNSTIDVIAINPTTNLPAYTKNGWLEPLDDYVTRPDAADWDWGDFGYAPRSYSKADGKLYAIPILGSRSMLFYRKDLFAAKGLEPPTNYEEFESVAAALTDPDSGVYGIAMRGEKSALTSQLSRFIYAYGGSFIENGICVYDSPESIEGVRFYGRMLGKYGPPGILSAGYNQMSQLFNTGQVAMVIDAGALLSSLTDPAESRFADHVGVAPVPNGPLGITENSNMNSWSTAIYSGSKQKDAAWEFVKFATSKDNLAVNTINGMLSYRKSVLERPDVIANLYPGYLDALKFYDAEADKKITWLHTAVLRPPPNADTP